MNDLGFGEQIPFFMTVGGLRELLKNYPDGTPITVCGTPGLFYPNDEQQCILLETMDCSGYEALSDVHSAATVGQEYMDF